MDIVQEIREDREKGAKRLEIEYRDRLLAVAVRVCGDPVEAESFVNQTFAEVLEHIETLSNPESFFSWMCSILVNIHSKATKRKEHERVVYTDKLPEHETDGAGKVFAAVDAEILRDAIRELPADMKESLLLHYFMDMPLKKVAQILSVPVGTVMSRLHYARILLARRLGAKLKKPAVALIALGLFLAASAAAIVVAVRGGNEATASETTETVVPDVPAGSDCHLQSVNNQEGEMEMNIKARAMTALAAATLATAPAAQARTVAWYHFNEGENGTKPANAQPVFVNAADPGSLDATPRVRRSWSTVMEFVDNNATYLPVYTNDFPSCVSWFDPSTGARGEDRRCLWMHTAYNYGHGDAPIVLVDDNEKLHCANITAECMVKLTVPSGSKLSYQSHMLAMRNSPTSEPSSNVKAWALILNANGTVRVEMQTRNSTGLAKDDSKSMAFVTPTTSPSVMDGKWHHVAFTYDGSTVRIYVDYVEYASQAWSEPIDYNENLQGRLNIAGLDVSNYGGHWYGFIDEVRISNEALPPEKFLRVGGIDKGASDPDTVVYLPLDAFEYSADAFFGTVGQPILHNSACSTNANFVKLSLSTISYGLLPRLDTGAGAVVSNELHSGIFATNSVANDGCWTFTNNQMVAGSAAQTGKSRHVDIDDYTGNGGTHLISSGDFTMEFHLRLLETPTRVSNIICENSGAKGGQTLNLRVSENWLYCSLASQEQFNKYEAGEISAMTMTDLYEPVSSIADGKWHHVALVVNRMDKTAELYLDGNHVTKNGRRENFTLASSVSTKTGSWPKLKIGDRDDGNNTQGFHNMSIDEFRITRRALAPQEFLMTGAAPASGALDPTRMWIGFEGDLSVKPDEGAISEGSSSATTVTMEYSSLVPGIRLIDGNGNLIRASNASSLRFSGAYGSGEASPDTASQRLFFERNILLERDMKSMTVEFFMRGAKNEAKAWATILRMYGNATGSDSSPFRRLWSVGYSNTAGNLYVIKDVNGDTQPTFYPSNTVSFADGKWHHIAVTFEPDGNGNTLCNVYKDYQQLGSEHMFTGEMECGDYDTSSFAVGSRYNGYLDEIRVSKGVLTVNEMLHAQPRGTALHLR